MPRVEILLLSDSAQSVADAFRQGLLELGYVEGQTIALEYRWAEGKEERFPGLASELVHLKVDVIFATVAAAAQAAKTATKAIPLVTAVNDPVAAGFVASVARPGGNITGLSMMGRVPSLVEKRSGAFFRLVKCTTNAPPCRAATGGTRHGQGHQGRSAGTGA